MPETNIEGLRLVGVGGTNKVMMGELSRLSRRALGRIPPKPRKSGTGQLIYPWDPELANVAVHYHRTCSRVLSDLFASAATRLEPLYEELVAAVKADARTWWGTGATISVTARNVDAFAAGVRQVVGTVKNALIDGAAAHGVELTVEPNNPDLHLVARMHDDILSVSLDLGGGSMTKRGYRLRAGKAPLRENLAATMVMLARHDSRSEVLLDPMSGSGTIPIEGALMARAAPLWVPPRAPAIASLPELANRDIPAGSPASVALFDDTIPRVVAIEIDPEIAAAARRNARAAGVAEVIGWHAGDFRDVDRERVGQLSGSNLESGVVVCNPPYGERLTDADLRGLYRDLYDWCQQFVGWRAAFLVANPVFEEVFGRPRVSKSLPNGPLRAQFYLYDL